MQPKTALTTATVFAASIIDDDVQMSGTPLFDRLYTRYVIECARNGNTPLSPQGLRSLIDGTAEWVDGANLAEECRKGRVGAELSSQPNRP